MLFAAIKLVLPAFVFVHQVCIDLKSSTARMVGALNSQAVAMVDATWDVEDHDIIEKIGAGEAEAVVAVCLGEMGILLVIMGMVHEVIK